MDYAESNRLLREYLRQTLEEDAYRRHTGEYFSVKERIAKYIDDSLTPEYYFTMTSIDKIGINPQTGYNTPIGIYSYPLNTKYYKMLINNKLPFVSDAPHCTILKLVKKGILVVGDNSSPGELSPEQSKLLQFKAVKIIHPDYDDSEIQDRIESANDANIHRDKNYDAQLFGLTFILTKRKGPMAWNSLLRQLGIFAIQDPGFGVIHPSEPSQCVFLSRSGCVVMESFDTRTVRRDTSPEAIKSREILADLLTNPTSKMGQLSTTNIINARKLIDNFNATKLKAVLTNPGLERLNSWAYIRALSVAIEKGVALVPELLAKMSPRVIAVVANWNGSNEKTDLPVLQWLVQSSQPANVEAALADGTLPSYVWKELIYRAKGYKLPDIFGVTHVMKTPKISKPAI